MGYDDQWFEHHKVRYEPADDLNQLFRERGFKQREHRGPKDRHYPTDAGVCPRKRVLQFLGAPESNPPDFTSNMTFAMGSALGDVLANVAMNAGVGKTAEERALFYVAELERPFSGRIDITIQDPFFDTHVEFWMAENQLIPVEYKTIKQKGYDNDEGYDGRPLLGVISMPKKDHVMQVHHYMHFLNAPYGYVFYMNKNDQRTACHRVYWSDTVWKEIVADAQFVEAYAKAGIVPTRESLPHKGTINFYQKRMYETVVVKTGEVVDGEPVYKEDKILVAEPGDINWNNGKFPCMWKGKDGGDPGCCSLLHLCYRDIILKLGSAKEQEIARRFDHFQFKEGVLNVGPNTTGNGAPEIAVSVPTISSEPESAGSPA